MRPIKEAVALIFASSFLAMGWGAYICSGSRYCQDDAAQYGMTIGLGLAVVLLVWRYWEHVKPGRLDSRIARIFFLFGLTAVTPWIFGRLIHEISSSGDVFEYLKMAFFLPFTDRYYEVHWYDCLAYLGWIALVIAFWWRYVGALIFKLIEWVNVK